MANLEFFKETVVQHTAIWRPAFAYTANDNSPDLRTWAWFSRRTTVRGI